MLENPQKLRLFHKKNVNITILLSCYYHAIIMLFGTMLKSCYLSLKLNNNTILERNKDI